LDLGLGAVEAIATGVAAAFAIVAAAFAFGSRKATTSTLKAQAESIEIDRALLRLERARQRTASIAQATMLRYELTDMGNGSIGWKIENLSNVPFVDIYVEARDGTPRSAVSVPHSSIAPGETFTCPLVEGQISQIRFTDLDGIVWIKTEDWGQVPYERT
jgi:hypothetical protein